MECNVGKTEKVIRILLGIIIIGWGLNAGSWLGLIGLLLLVTGILNFCPLYKLIGFSTCKTHPQGK